MVDKKENVLVEFDYQNIFLIDPNKTIDADGNVKERLVNHEELVVYANLECNVLPRTKLSVGIGNDSKISTISIAKINFLSPDGKKFLDNGYTNDVTFVSDKKGSTSTQSTSDTLSQTTSTKYAVRNDDTSSSLLGITNIIIKNNSSFQSTVNIELEDIRGRALFELGDKSPYAAFFNLPYPLFYLTVKGYYGKAVKLALMLQNFSARFNTGTGNFNVSLTFFTYKYSMIAEVPMAALAAVPHMYKSTFKQVSTTNNSPTNTTSPTNDIVLERGRQKVTELYGEYKTKGIIPEDFPEITLWELYKRLELFLKNIESSYSKIEMAPLSDLDVYTETLSNYSKTIDTAQPSSWANTWLDRKNYVITKKNIKYYSLKKELTEPSKIEDALSALSKVITENNQKLNENPTCGSNGNYKFIDNKKQTPTVIVSNISVSDIHYTDKLDIDWCKTYISQTGAKTCINPDNSETDLFKTFRNNFQQNQITLSNQNGEIKEKIDYFTLDVFYDKKNQYAKKNDEIRQKIEEDITVRLAEKIKSKDSGIGFDPTIKNVLAVIFASGEAFLRLMDEVHTKAWAQNQNSVRQSAIFSSTASMDNIPSPNGTTPVYPWPQYVVEKSNTDKNSEIYQITYPGDPDQISVTKANDYEAWPEVEFVEQFIYGLTQREKPTETPNDLLNETKQPLRVSLNAIEFPINNVVYRNQEQSKFFYEIWERLFVASFYNGLNREGAKDAQINEVISESEKEDIKIALGNFSPYISNILKQFKIDKSNFTTLLRHISNDGIGDSWQNFIRNNYVTPYIKNFTNVNYGIFDNSILTSTESQSTTSANNQDKLYTYLKSTKSNKFIFTDTYPFTDLTWLKNNMANGNAIQNTDIYNNTSNVINHDTSRNIICNFDQSLDLLTNRPITNFNYLGTIDAQIPKSLFDLEFFYDFRLPTDQLPTEGNITYSLTGLSLPLEQTTSMLNTPFFINSIQTGVREYQASKPYPFVNAAYFFLNSLPLATLRERYKTYKNSVATDLDYISATLNKFGAVHKLPYAWILKYGSIWHRYKVWKETGIDIISNSNNDDWTDFNYLSNYDPLTSSPTTQYSLSYPDIATTGTNTSTIILEQNVPVNIFTTNTVMNTGFYPGLINDFNLFCQGLYVFNNYTSNDIQNAINNGLTLLPGSSNPKGTFISKTNFDTNLSGRTLFLKTWSCYVPQTGTSETTLLTNMANQAGGRQSSQVYLMPSFGSNVNQAYFECFDTKTTQQMKIEITGNTSMYNGSVRLFWGAPNYGYFNYSGITKPTPEEYLKSIYINQKSQDNFTLNKTYTDISEMFSVFNKEILDSFESEFLKFSKVRYDYNPKTDRENFHLMMRNMLLIDTPKGSSYEDIISDAQTKQITNIVSIIKTFLQKDVVLKYGNPSNFDRKIFYSLSTIPSVDPYTYLSYSSNSQLALPKVGTTTTLAISKNNYPNAWAALESYVGYSNITGLVYTDNGSYITDFFIDMDVEFTEDNVINLAPLIKIYATQKLKDNTLNKVKFTQMIDDYLNSNTTFQDTIIDSLFPKLNAELPTYSETNDSPKNSAVDGKQTKVELWETFKAINDKWISGYDFTNKTLLEDVLLLDRASRNIGDQIRIDIYKLKDILFDFGSLKSNMFDYVSTLIQDNHFMILTMPSYINFYNVQDAVKNPTPKIEGSLEFANTLFGTHENVDIRDSSPKMVCLYGGIQSSQLALPENPDVGRKDDSFDLTKPDNPLVEDQTNKTDYAFSNRVVGFSVDMGIRNQNIFYSIQVDQSPGKATSESYDILTNIADEAGGRKSYTQNVSLWNFYKTRSYTCTVSCLGNVLIQPTMYFNLRHVPMFYGPYMITEVSHTITPGRFETIFNGTRQSIASLPPLPDFIQSLNTNLVQNIKTKLKNDRQNGVNLTTNIKNEQDQIINSVNGVAKISDSVEYCQSGLSVNYKTYVHNDEVETILTLTNAKTLINSISTIESVRTMIFVTMYINSISNDKTYLTSFDYNYGLAPLNVSYGGDLSKLFKSPATFDCLKKESVSLPYATFNSNEDHIKFLETKWNSIVAANQLSIIDENTVTKAYVNYYPDIKGTLYDAMKNNGSLNGVIKKVKEALNEWTKLNQ
jgi:hypothetical protein